MQVPFTWVFLNFPLNGLSSVVADLFLLADMMEMLIL